MKKYHNILLLLVLFFSTYAAEARIYKWVDAEGNVHYGEKPVGEKSQEVIINSRGKKTLEPVNKPERKAVDSDKLMRSMEADRHARDEKRRKKKKANDDRQRRCVRAKDRLRRFQRATSLYNLDKTGNRSTLSDAERQKSTARVQADIKKYCK